MEKRYALAVLPFLFACPASAHDPYSALTQPGTGYSCCNGKATSATGDCEEVPSRFAFGTWFAFKGDKWIEVPQTKVLNVDSFNGRAHLCFSEARQEVLCFVKPGADG